MADQNKNEVVITKVFDAPREIVWKAWSDPEMFKKWWGPQGFTCPAAKIDFKVGGKYHVAMHGPAGTEFDKDLWSTGTFKEIIPMEKIVYTDSFADEEGNAVSSAQYGMEGFPMETQVTVTFEDVDGKTKMTLKHQGIAGVDEKMLNDMEQGWSQSFDKLAVALK